MFPREIKEVNSGIQLLYRFPNNFGASVVRHKYSYGGADGLWELAVIKWGSQTEEWNITYDTPITGDVVGFLSEPEVSELLTMIRDLEDNHA